MTLISILLGASAGAILGVTSKNGFHFFFNMLAAMMVYAAAFTAGFDINNG